MQSITIGIIGGTGWIGRGVADHLLQHVIPSEQLWIANRSGELLAFETAKRVHYTQDNQELVDHCDVVIVSVRPQQLSEVTITLHSQLLISVMAGVTVEAIVERTNATSVVRAMPNAALEIGQSFTPWYSRYLPLAHQQWTQQILSSFGTEQALSSESQLDYFTALTGSGQGVLATIAGSMIEAAIAQGIAPTLAEQAIRQLFSGVGQLIACDELSPQDRAQVCLDYAGTTAAAIQGLRETGIDKAIRAGLEAAHLKAKSDMMLD